MARQKLSAKDVVSEVPAAAPEGRQPLTDQHVVTEPPGVGETALRHGLQGLTLKFSDELAGFGSVIGDRLASLRHGLTPAPAGQIYDEGRNEERAALTAGAAAHPGVALASEVAGGLLLPLPGATAVKGATLGAKALRGAAVGAGAGALAGAGGADELSDVPLEAVKGAAIGGALGGAIPVAPAAAAKTIGAGKRVAGKVLEKAKDVATSKAVEVIADMLPLPPIVTKAVGKAIKGALSRSKISKDVKEVNPEWFLPNSETVPALKNEGFPRPYDAAERAKFGRPIPEAKTPLDPALVKWAEEAAAAEKARRASPSVQERFERRVRGEAQPELETSAKARELLNSQPPSVAGFARRPPPVPDTIVDPLNIRPILKSAQRDVVEHAPLPVPEAPPPAAPPAKVEAPAPKDAQADDGLEALLQQSIDAAKAKKKLAGAVGGNHGQRSLIPTEDRGTVEALTNVVSSKSRDVGGLKHYPKSPEAAFKGYLDELPKSDGGTKKGIAKALRDLVAGVKKGADPGPLIYRARAAGARNTAIMEASFGRAAAPKTVKDPILKDRMHDLTVGK